MYTNGKNVIVQVSVFKASMNTSFNVWRYDRVKKVMYSNQYYFRDTDSTKRWERLQKALKNYQSKLSVWNNTLSIVWPIRKEIV